MSLAADLAALVQVPSVTGDERAALERLGGLAEALGLQARLVEHDLAALRAHPDHPGEEAPRDELLTLHVTGPPGPRRIAFCAHVDVVPPGTAAWVTGSPWSGRVVDGELHGRGAVDMKGGVIAALHALPHAPGAELVAVSSEEDGGLGSFAVLQADPAYDACIIPEPTGFGVVCAQAGALTFTGEVRGRAAHAAHRLEGVSAIDRYLPVHAALRAYEAAVNADVEHPLMAELELPYPLEVGRLEAGEWSSSVPDRLIFEGRAPVRVGEGVAAAMAGVEAALEPVADVALRWTGGRFASAQTPADHPLVAAALAAVGGSARPVGVPWGADMRLWCGAGIPTVMVGTSGIELSHGVDERVSLAEVEALVGVLTRIASSAAQGRWS